MRRRLVSRPMRQSALAVLLAFSTVLPAFAGSDHKRSSAAVDIDNFGQVNDHIYRGSQPKADNYRQLAALGVKTIVDLRGDAKRDEKAGAEEAGLRYINLPLGDKQYPPADAAEHFLNIVNDQANWPVYVHCAGGRHRTGSMVAVYRITVDHWTLDQAYAEMKQYDFYTGGGHGCYKDYVYDYYNKLQARSQAQVAAEDQAVSKLSDTSERRAVL